MDQFNLPTWALCRNTGTVIVRLKGDVRRSTGYSPSSSPEVHHRPSGCEQCNRARLISKYSDCDSGVVEKCRPYRSSTARSRFVNVSAALCLLLLFGGLAPRSSATPFRRIMSRQKRSTENPIWENPCEFRDSNPNREVEDPKNLASKLVAQANNAYTITAEYKDLFACKLHSFSSFDNLLSSWKDDQWLREFDWMPEEGFPKDKVLNQPMPDEYMKTVINKINEDPTLLPAMYKGLKVVVAGLHGLLEKGLDLGIADEVSMQDSINKTLKGVQAVLCYFSGIMEARQLPIMPLSDSEFPDFQERLKTGLLIYRDTLNYLEYLKQVFQVLYEL